MNKDSRDLVKKLGGRGGGGGHRGMNVPMWYFKPHYLERLYFSLQEEFNAYGVDWNGPVPSLEFGSLLDNDVEGIEVPDIMVPFSLQTVSTTLNRINPLGRSNNYGIDLYQMALSLLRNRGNI